MTISKRTRYEVLRRDSFTCRYCGSKAPDVELHVDHVMPTALGGSDKPNNLVAACRDCNAGKASSSPDEAVLASVAEDSAQWLEARRRASEEAALERVQLEHDVLMFLCHWRGWDADEVFLPPHAEATVRNWLSSGLTLDDILEAHDIAMSARHISVYKVWRYMCGVLRRRQEELDTRTEDILSEGGK